MIKKTIISAAAALVVALFFLGRDLVSYVRTSAGYVQSSVTDSVPMEFQITRARDMIDDLVPEIRKNMHVIAKEEVGVEKLDKQIADTQKRLAKDKEEILRLKTDVQSSKPAFEYAGRSYTVQQVKQDLANRFDRYKTCEATMGSLKDIYRARQKSLEAARQKLEGTLAAKRQLYVEVENLQARLQMVAAAQTSSQYNFDESRVGRVRALIADLKTRLDVSEKLVNVEGQFHDQIPLDETVPTNITEQVSNYFQAEKAKVHPAAREEIKKDQPPKSASAEAEPWEDLAED
jgi:chromosome segregation ATPase